MAVRNVLFEIKTPQCVVIRTTKDYWEIITTIKHPSIAKYTKQAKDALKDPDQIRRSRQDKRVHLYYKNLGKLYICVVADNINKEEGYIITAYLTDRIKEGEEIYVKN